VIQETVWETVTGMPTWTGVSVETVNVTAVSLAPATATLALNQTQQMTPAITPANATNKRVSWSSSNAAVASVSAAGVVTGVSAGTATITVTTQDGGKTATSEITVTSNPVAVESISVAPTSAVVNTRNTVTLTAAITPSFATNKNITWSSSNAAVATVSTAGVVTGVSAGAATITVTTQDGAKTATSAITVTANAKPVAVLSATPASGFAPLNVRFSAANSSDPNNGDFILGYEWDFGDGSPRANSNAPSHTYRTAGTYTVTLRVMDNHDLYSDPVTTTITANAIDPNASVVIEYWSNVGGTSTDEVPVSTPPTSTSFLTSLEIPADVADNYGARIRGLLKPTVSGEYTFYVASDDGSKVFLSTDATPANKALIASVTGWTSQKEWTKYPSQRSAPVSLVAGQEYYFEILYKEGNGGDNLALGWTGPGISAITVIGGSHIKQYVQDPNAPVPPSVPSNLVSSNVSQTGFTVSWNASTGTVASYNVYVGGNLAGNATTTSFNVTGLTAATSYSVTVRAVGTGGTLSAASTALSVRTAGSTAPSTGAKSLDLSFTNPADAERFGFIFDTGGESVKTVENGVMKLVLNKKEWHFYQVYIDPFDFINNPYVSLRIKVDQATPIKMWIKKGEGDANRKDLYEQTLQASADYQTIFIHVTDLAPLVGDMSEVGIDIGGYQVPPATFAGTVYIDHFRLGEAATGNPTPDPDPEPEPSVGAKSLNLTFTDPADADRFIFNTDTGGESVKTVENGIMKLVINKLSWHFYQLMIDPFDFINNPYVSFRIKVDQNTPIRMWIKRGVNGPEKELFNQSLQAGADFQTINLHFTDLAPLTGDATELGMDIGGYQPVEGTRFAGTAYLDFFRLGEAAKPGAIVERDEIAPTCAIQSALLGGYHQ
jgi:PKD repeat protein